MSRLSISDAKKARETLMKAIDKAEHEKGRSFLEYCVIQAMNGDSTLANAILKKLVPDLSENHQIGEGVRILNVVFKELERAKEVNNDKKSVKSLPEST